MVNNCCKAVVVLSCGSLLENFHFRRGIVNIWTTVLPAKSDSDVMFCLQSYQGLRINRLLVY